MTRVRVASYRAPTDEKQMQYQDFTEIISQTAQLVFRQPSVRFSPAATFREIPGFDSILAIQFILAIESALDVTLNEDEVDNMHTMGDLLALLEAKKKFPAGV
jgi:acyl carrier protein